MNVSETAFDTSSVLEVLDDNGSLNKSANLLTTTSTITTTTFTAGLASDEDLYVNTVEQRRVLLRVGIFLVFGRLPPHVLRARVGV